MKKLFAFISFKSIYFLFSLFVRDVIYHENITSAEQSVFVTIVSTIIIFIAQFSEQNATVVICTPCVAIWANYKNDVFEI